jgi:hypothetical protein
MTRALPRWITGLPEWFEHSDGKWLCRLCATPTYTKEVSEDHLTSNRHLAQTAWWCQGRGIIHEAALRGHHLKEPLAVPWPAAPWPAAPWPAAPTALPELAALTNVPSAAASSVQASGCPVQGPASSASSASQVPADAEMNRRLAVLEENVQVLTDHTVAGGGVAAFDRRLAVLEENVQALTDHTFSRLAVLDESVHVLTDRIERRLALLEDQVHVITARIDSLSVRIDQWWPWTDEEWAEWRAGRWG